LLATNEYKSLRDGSPHYDQSGDWRSNYDVRLLSLTLLDLPNDEALVSYLSDTCMMYTFHRQRSRRREKGSKELGQNCDSHIHVWIRTAKEGVSLWIPTYDSPTLAPDRLGLDGQDQHPENRRLFLKKHGWKQGKCKAVFYDVQ